MSATNPPLARPAALALLKHLFWRPAARRKLLAFASLVALLVFFSLASPNFLQVDNFVSILQATAVNGVLAIASTFVIVSAGITRSMNASSCPACIVARPQRRASHVIFAAHDISLDGREVLLQAWA